MKAVALSLVVLLLAGCFSATSLRCGVSDDASYVELINMPQDLASQSRYFGELCGFAYEVEGVVRLQGVE